MSPPLAAAFLALADDDAFADQRTRPRVLASAAAAVVLALGAPLGVLSLRPADHPVAALSSKSSLGQDEE
jgi:hypothetical protein